MAFNSFGIFSLNCLMRCQIKEEEWLFNVKPHCSLSTTNTQVTDAFVDDAKGSRAPSPVLNLSSRRLSALRHRETNPQIAKECGVKSRIIHIS